MSINMPSGLQWVAKLAGGGWPEGDEDKLWELDTAHREFAKSVRELLPELQAALEEVRGGLSGPAEDAFEAYLKKLLVEDLPGLATAGDQLADMLKNMGLQVQYSKIMILEMLVWMAAQIAFLAWWAPEAVPGIVAAGTAAIRMILTRLLAAVAVNVAMAGLMDAIAQLIQMGQAGEAHRSSWDFDATKMALGAGAINGAVAGLMFTGAGAVAPGLLATLAGKMGVGAAAGALGMELTDLAFGIDGDPGLGALAGAVGGAIGHIPAVRGGKGGAGARGDGDIEVPGMGAEKPGLGDGTPGLNGAGAEGAGTGAGAHFGAKDTEGYYGGTSREGGDELPAYPGGRPYKVPLFGDVQPGHEAPQPPFELMGKPVYPDRGVNTDLTGFAGEGGTPLTISHPGEEGAGGGPGRGTGSGEERRPYDDVSDAGSGPFNDDVTVSAFGPEHEPLILPGRWDGFRAGEDPGAPRGNAGSTGSLDRPQGLPGFEAPPATARELPGFETQGSTERFGVAGPSVQGGTPAHDVPGVPGQVPTERPGPSGDTGGRLTEEALHKHDRDGVAPRRSVDDWVTDVDRSVDRSQITPTEAGTEDLAGPVDAPEAPRTVVTEPFGHGQELPLTEAPADPRATGAAPHGTGDFATPEQSSAPAAPMPAHEQAPTGAGHEVVPKRSQPEAGQEAPVGSESGRGSAPVESQSGPETVVAPGGESVQPTGHVEDPQGPRDVSEPAGQESVPGPVPEPEHVVQAPQPGHGQAPAAPAPGHVSGDGTEPRVGAGAGRTGTEEPSAQQPLAAPYTGAAPTGRAMVEQTGGVRGGEPPAAQPPHEPQAPRGQAPLGSEPAQRQPVVQAPGGEPAATPRPTIESGPAPQAAGGQARVEGRHATLGADTEQTVVAGASPRTAPESLTAPQRPAEQRQSTSQPRPTVEQEPRAGAPGGATAAEGAAGVPAPALRPSVRPSEPGGGQPRDAGSTANPGSARSGGADAQFSSEDTGLSHERRDSVHSAEGEAARRGDVHAEHGRVEKGHAEGSQAPHDVAGGEEPPPPGPRNRAYVFSPGDQVRVDGFNAAHEKTTRALEGRLSQEDQRFWQQRKADEALNAAQAEYVRGENIHGVPGAGRPDPQAWARQLVPEELVGPVADGYRAAVRGSGPDRGGDAEGRPVSGSGGIPHEQQLIEQLSERLTGLGHDLSLDEVARGMIRQAQDAGPEGWARGLGVPDELVGTVTDAYRTAVHESRLRGADGEPEGGAAALPGVDRVREHLSSRLDGVGHGLSVDTLADGLVRGQARAGRGGPTWRERVETRFNEGWQADLEELQRGDIAPSEFAQRFGVLVGGLHDEFELAAAADSARMSAEHAFDAVPGRPSGLTPADEARVRSDLAEAAANEVYKAAEGVQRTDDGRIEPSGWDGIHQRSRQGIDELTGGLRARLEAEEHAANGFDFVGRLTGTSRERLEELREEFAQDFEESTQRLPGPDGREVRRLPEDEWRAGRPRFERLADDVFDRWHGRLRAEAAEVSLRTQAEQIVNAFKPHWRQGTAHPDEFDRVDSTKVLDQYRDGVRDRARGELEGRAPKDIPGEQWEAYTGRLREADAAMQGQLRARFENQAGLQEWLRRADARLRDLPADGAAADRAREGVREELTDGYRELVGWPDQGAWPEHQLAVRQEQFRRRVYEPALESAADRVAFEQGAEQALRNAAGDLHDMTSAEQALRNAAGRLHDMTPGVHMHKITGRAARRFAMKDETFDKLADDYRSETGKQYHEYFGPARRDLGTWLESEKAGGDAFGNGLRERWEESEQQSPYQQRIRQQAAAEAAAWRAQMRDTFGDLAGRQSVLEDLQRTVGLDPHGFESAQARQSYERGVAGLRSGFTKAWSEAGQEEGTPEEAARIRAELVEQTRDRWQALSDDAQAHEAAYQDWRSRPTWTLRYPQLDINRDTFRFSPADEHTANETAPASGEHLPQETATAPGGQQQMAQLPAQHAGQAAPHETVREQPQRSATSAAQQSAPHVSQESAPHVSPARAAADERAAAELDALRDGLEARDEAYHEFQRHLEAFPRLRNFEAAQQVGPVREWYADARTAPSADGRQVPLGGQLHEQLEERLRRADADLAAHQSTRRLFDEQVESSLSPDLRPGVFSGSARIAQLRDDFHQAVVAAAGPAVTASAGDLQATLQAPPEVVERFRQEFARARFDWAAAESSFHGALQTRGPSGPQDLVMGRASWDPETHRWYRDRLDELRERYTADWAALGPAQDPAAEQGRLEEQLRQAAEGLQARAARTVGALRAFQEHLEATPWQPDGRWDPQLTSWYADEKAAIVQPLRQRLGEQGPSALRDAQREYDERAAALTQTARARHGISEDFRGLLAGRPPQQVPLTSPEMARWTADQIDAARNAYVQAREAAHAQQAAGRFADAPSYAAGNDWRRPAWQADQEQLHTEYGQRLEQAEEATRREEQQGAARAEFDDAFDAWAAATGHGLDEQHLHQARASQTHHYRDFGPQWRPIVELYESVLGGVLTNDPAVTAVLRSAVEALADSGEQVGIDPHRPDATSQELMAPFANTAHTKYASNGSLGATDDPAIQQRLLRQRGVRAPLGQVPDTRGIYRLYRDLNLPSQDFPAFVKAVFGWGLANGHTVATLVTDLHASGMSANPAALAAALAGNGPHLYGLVDTMFAPREGLTSDALADLLRPPHWQLYAENTQWINALSGLSSPPLLPGLDPAHANALRLFANDADRALLDAAPADLPSLLTESVDRAMQGNPLDLPFLLRQDATIRDNAEWAAWQTDRETPEFRAIHQEMRDSAEQMIPALRAQLPVHRAMLAEALTEQPKAGTGYVAVTVPADLHTTDVTRLDIAQFTPVLRDDPEQALAELGQGPAGTRPVLVRVGQSSAGRFPTTAGPERFHYPVATELRVTSHARLTTADGTEHELLNAAEAPSGDREAAREGVRAAAQAAEVYRDEELNTPTQSPWWRPVQAEPVNPALPLSMNGIGFINLSGRDP
ncbi:hypothetical protein ACFWBS_36440, partial [Streptomyces mirabilis]